MLVLYTFLVGASAERSDKTTALSHQIIEQSDSDKTLLPFHFRYWIRPRCGGEMTSKTKPKKIPWSFCAIFSPLPDHQEPSGTVLLRHARCALRLVVRDSPKTVSDSCAQCYQSDTGALRVVVRGRPIILHTHQSSPKSVIKPHGEKLDASQGHDD